MSDTPTTPHAGEELTPRERQVLEAVVRTYVETAEPAGSRTVGRRFDLGVSAATIRNTMSDLEEKGYLLHPHTSAGRVPTDRAYRFYVDRLIQPRPLTSVEEAELAEALDPGAAYAVEHLVRNATRALSLLSQELGLAVAPRLDEAALEKLDLLPVSHDSVVMVASIRSGVVRTVYVNLPGEVPRDTLDTVARILNERLSGLTLSEIRATLPDRLRDAAPGDDPASGELLNIFMQSAAELMQGSAGGVGDLHLGQASVLAAQPEFTTGESLVSLLRLTEQRDVLSGALVGREHPHGLQITIGSENTSLELADFTLVTAQYQVGGLKGVVGVIGPTRMPYEKVIAIVESTSRLVTRILT
ncbi:MAG: heat-inducible transcriptional repressor HrcA [Longimicrobiales bacterium]|nr:heat-inducible transcriptional repressor HrcA [Longimicrobiales bacterium]